MFYYIDYSVLYLAFAFLESYVLEKENVLIICFLSDYSVNFDISFNYFMVFIKPGLVSWM